jgi:hypothetical protein
LLKLAEEAAEVNEIPVYEVLEDFVFNADGVV